jgi:hypothetical protein
MRLRELTGNQQLKSQAMIDSEHLSAGDLASEYLWRPFVLFFEPILLVYNTYLALIYGTLASSSPSPSFSSSFSLSLPLLRYRMNTGLGLMDRIIVYLV